jgi:hypothetical protein
MLIEEYNRMYRWHIEQHWRQSPGIEESKVGAMMEQNDSRVFTNQINRIETENKTRSKQCSP